MTEIPDVKLDAGLVVKDRYVIVRLLGAGGMGAVYEARDQVLDKRVALKILHASIAGDPHIHARFLQEARAASALDHPHVVKSLDFGTHEGAPFLVMEFLEGESFADLLAREGALSPVRALSLLEPVARAIERAHRTGIIHRDIKPDNVFLARGEQGDECVPKLVDFGIARRTQTAELRLTKTSVAMGTPFYMPPEQAMGAKDVSAAADQYAFAVMLYEAVAKSFPHDGESYNELIVNKVTREPRPLNEIQPGIPSPFRDVVMRALSREPAARYPSMDAFRQALLEAIGQPLPPATNAGNAGSPDGHGQRGAFDDTIARSPSMETDTRKRSMTSVRGVEKSVIAPSTVPTDGKRSRRIAAIAGALAFVAVAGFGASRLIGGDRATPMTLTVTNTPAGSAYALAVGEHLADAQGPAAPLARRTVRISVVPASATITADGVLVGTGSATMQVESGRAVSLRLQAPGHLARTEDLRVETDQSIERVLQRAPSPADTAPSAQTVSAVRQPNAPRAPTGAPELRRQERRQERREERRLRRTGIQLDQTIPGS
jgi:serine/threonine protein kinase